jgi:ATP-dependent DNA helicase DinG
MLQSYQSDINDVAVVFAHVGTKADRGNRIYAIAANILNSNTQSRTFESLVRYHNSTSRERYYSNISKEKLLNAPETSVVFQQVKKFLKDTPIILTLPYQDNLEDIKKLFPEKRIIDLGFAVEFLLPHIDSFSPKRLWEFLHHQERKRIYFTASEVTALSKELIEHICGNELNDAIFPRASAIRYYLKKSNTLFGTIFLHFARNYEKYFNALFNPCQRTDTDNWKSFLPTVPSKLRKTQKEESLKKINLDGLESIYRGLSQSIKGFTFRPSQVEYARTVAQAINDEAVLTIEAGTGTGKTQGYLIPVMEFLARNKDESVVISTYTKNLQNQIFQQEIEFIRKENKLYMDIPVSLLKGKSN